MADKVKHLDFASFPNTCRIKHLDDKIADGMSALSEHILLIVFVIIPVLISWLDLQLGFPLACPLHSKEFEFE